MAIEHTPLASSNLASAGYDAATRTLEVSFVSGSTYQYADVSPETYEGLLAASSAGSYFAANIRNAYATSQV